MTDSQRSAGSPGVTVVRVIGRLLGVVAAGATGAALAITVLGALDSGFNDLPVATLLVLGVIAVVAFGAAMISRVIADRMAESAERHALEGPDLTPEEREAERLREMPLLARESARRGNQPPPTGSSFL